MEHYTRNDIGKSDSQTQTSANNADVCLSMLQHRYYTTHYEHNFRSKNASQTKEYINIQIELRSRHKTNTNINVLLIHIVRWLDWAIFMNHYRKRRVNSFKAWNKERGRESRNFDFTVQTFVWMKMSLRTGCFLCILIYICKTRLLYVSLSVIPILKVSVWFANRWLCSLSKQLSV